MLSLTLWYIALAGLLAFILLIIVTERRRLAWIPGPKGWPLLGSSLQINSCYPHQTMTAWAKQYGGLFTVGVPMDNWVVANSFEAIYEVLISSGITCAARPIRFRHRMLSRNNKDIAFSNPSHPAWKSLRKGAQQGIRQYGDGIARIERILSEVVGDLVIKLRNYEGQPIDIRDDIYEFNIKSALIFLTGKKLEDEDLYSEAKNVGKLYISAMSFSVGRELDAFPWLRFFGNKTYATLAEANRRSDALWAKIWTSTMRDLEDGNQSRCILHVLAGLTNNDNDNYDPAVDEESLKAVFVDIIMGAVQTTTSSAYSLLNILLHHPEVARRLQQEVDEIIGRRPVRLSDREHMPYTQATIYELLRYTTVVPITRREALEDTTIIGHNIPKGIYKKYNMYRSDGIYASIKYI